MIEVCEVEKRFGDRSAVRSVSFTAQDHAITGLLGVNGAGKSTTLRIISGVLKPSAGRVLIDGVPILTATVEAQAHLGALLDHTGLYPRLTTRQNLAYFGRLRHLPTELLRQGIEHWITALGVGKIADRPTAGFSQGERMKVALGRVLLHSPANLLLDEPTNELDILSIRICVSAGELLFGAACTFRIVGSQNMRSLPDVPMFLVLGFAVMLFAGLTVYQARAQAEAGYLKNCNMTGVKIWIPSA